MLILKNIMSVDARTPGVDIWNVLNALCFLDLGFCSVTDEDWLASPFDDDVLSFGDGGKIDLDLGLC